MTDGLHTPNSTPVSYRTRRHGGYLFGAIILLIGIALLLSNVLPWFNFWAFFWPVLLITIGLFVIFRRRQ